MCNGGNCSGVLGARPHPGPLSPCPTSYLLETVGLDQSLRTSMTTNQLSLVRTAIGRGTQFREPLTRRPVRANVMPCAFASLRLCVLTASVPTQRRRGAKTQREPGQEAVDWIGRPRAIAENRSARLLTDERWTASRWNGDGPLRPVSIATSAATHPGRSVVIREIRVIRGQPLLAKLDDLPPQMLGARMAMLNVLILGSEQSEATTDVPERQSHNQSS